MQLPTQFSLLVEPSIILRTLSADDAPELFQVIDTNRSHLRQFLGWLDANTSVDHSRAFIKSEKEKLATGESFTLGIYFSNSLAGLLSLYNIDSLNRSASVGYWLAEKYQGQGMVVKSMRSLLEYAFTHLQLHRIELRCAVHNHKSMKVATSLGFHKEGLLKEAISHYGTYFDAYLYALIGGAVP
jgi:ribosomal-protein-serine acetyltransferase